MAAVRRLRPVAPLRPVAARHRATPDPGPSQPIRSRDVVLRRDDARLHRHASTWTFTQATPTAQEFTATTTVLQGPITFDYAINPGITVGPIVVGVETLSVLGAPPFPLGLLIAIDQADVLVGVLIGLDGSLTEVNGEKVVVIPPVQSRRR